MSDQSTVAKKSIHKNPWVIIVDVVAILGLAWGIFVYAFPSTQKVEQHVTYGEQTINQNVNVTHEVDVDKLLTGVETHVAKRVGEGATALGDLASNAATGTADAIDNLQIGEKTQVAADAGKKTLVNRVNVVE